MNPGVILLLLSAAPTTGGIAPILRLNGSDAQGACSYTARPDDPKKTTVFESASGSTLDVPPGRYVIQVECRDRGARLTSPGPTVTVRAGKKATPRIDVRSAAVRIETRRNGIMLPGKVQLFSPGAPQTKPVVTLKSNARAHVAAGRYDLLVELEDPESPRAEALFTRMRIGGSKVQVIRADLSDGGLIVRTTNNGRAAAGSVRVFVPGHKRDVGLVDTGKEIRLPAGRYVVSTELHDTTNFATKKRELWIRAGKTNRFTESFDTGLLSVTITKDRKPVDATVRISLPGASDFFNHFSAPGTVTLSPGTYDIAIESKAHGALGAIVERNIRVSRRSHTKKKLDLTPATLTVTVRKNGKRVDAAVLVRAAGGGKKVAEPDPSGITRLWPGRYEVVATLENGDEAVEGPFEVSLGQRLRKKVEIHRATLTVDAMRGKTVASDAQVFIFKHGAGKPTARARPGAKIELSPGTFDVKVIAGPDVVWKEGIKVKRRQTLRIELPPQKGGDPLPEGDLLPPGDDMPEGDDAIDSPKAPKDKKKS